jgi:hypothetical protein
MKSLLLILCLISTSAFAVGYEEYKSNFTISERTGDGARVYYNCDSVESAVEDMLVKLGALDINVRCSGGLDQFGNMHMPANIKSSYRAINLESDSDVNMSVGVESEKIRNRSQCHLLNSVFMNIKGNFEIASFSKRSCLRSSDRALIKFDVIKEM